MIFHKTKHLVWLIACLLAGQTLLGNMANPIQAGSPNSEVLVHRELDILHERLRIELDSSTGRATYLAEYRLSVPRDSIFMPLLFVGLDQEGDFQVWLNGESVALLPLPEEMAESGDSLTYGLLFGRPLDLWKDYQEQAVYPEDLRYFEVGLDSGEQVIRVQYQGRPWTNRNGWVTAFSFRYSLEPARYWKSFGGLELVLDAREWPHALSSNLPTPDAGRIDSVAQWRFSEVPVSVISLDYQPETSDWSRFLIRVHPDRMALGWAILLVLLHLWGMWRFRRRKKRPRVSSLAILGGLVIPVLAWLGWSFAYGYVEASLAPYGSGTQGYGMAMTIFLLPFVLVIYLLAAVVVDLVMGWLVWRGKDAGN